MSQDPTLSRSPSLSQLRVLLVEDNYFVAINVRKMLESLGCSVVGPVPSLTEGLALASEPNLHGAILDINIIGGTSVAIAEELGKRGTPFFFITGYASPSTLPDRLKSHVRLPKPVDDRRLEEMITRHFVSTQP